MYYVKNVMIGVLFLGFAALTFYLSFYSEYSLLVDGKIDHITTSTRMLVLTSVLLAFGISVLVFQPENVPLGPPGPWSTFSTRLKATFISTGVITIVASFYSFFWLQTKLDTYTPPLDVANYNEAPLSPEDEKTTVEKNQKIIEAIRLLLRERGFSETDIQKTLEGIDTNTQHVHPSQRTIILEGIYQNILTDT